MIDLIVIGGPTATGKTNYAIKLAQKCNGEIINADSRQVYKDLDIATNKGILVPTDKFIANTLELEIRGFKMEKTETIGWLFDLVTPDQEFNLATYQKLADIVISDIVKRGKTPILVGGSGLYIDAVIKGYNLPEQSIDPTLRQNLNKLTVNELQEMLRSKDSQTFDKLNNSDQNNPRRLIRLIEKYEQSQIQSSKPENQVNKYNVKFYYPEYTLEDLYTKIDKRVLEMFDQGLLAETERAVANGYENAKALQSFGYKEAISLLKGGIDKEACIASIQREHRRYAKRQITWFEGEGRGYKLLQFTV